MIPETELRPGQEEIRDHFRHNVDEWAEDRYSDETYRSRGRLAAKWLRAGSGLILDLGCGGGRQSLSAARAGYTVVSADFALEMVAAARERVAREAPGSTHHVVVCDGRFLPFRGASFDAAMTLGVIGYMEDARVYLAEVARTLKDGARLVCDVAVPDRSVIFTRLSGMLSAPFRWVRSIFGRRDGSHADFYDRSFSKYQPEELSGMLKDLGLTVEDQAGAGFGDIRVAGRPVLPWRVEQALSRLLSRITERRVGKRLARHSLIYVVSARLSRGGQPAHGEAASGGSISNR